MHKTGRDWATDKRCGKKIADVMIHWTAEINSAEDLVSYANASGFAKVSDWVDAIKQKYPEVKGYLFHVSLLSLPVYKRIGQCNQCGDCCRKETIPARVEAYKTAKVDFKLVNVDCNKFDPTTGKCLDYQNRPEACRKFPLLIADITALPNCSYHFEILLCPKCGAQLRAFYFLGDRNHLDFVDCPKCGIAYDPYTMKSIAHVVS